MRLWPRRQGSSLDLLVVGLGNPGREHARNRHNVGHLVADELARRHGGSWKSKFSGQLAEIRLDGHKVALLKPETYMNESGRAVSGATRFYKLEPGEVLVVHDEGDFELGRLELKVGGGLAGHNGLRPLADYVLSNFEPHDDAETLVARAADAVEQLDADGLEQAQREVNRR